MNRKMESYVRKRKSIGDRLGVKTVWQRRDHEIGDTGARVAVFGSYRMHGA